MTGDYFLHPNGICEATGIGSGTRIWAFAHVLPGARVGADCNICDHVFIENDVILGDRVTVKCGVQLWDGIRLEDNVFVGPNVTFANDKYPRSKVYPEQFAETRVMKGASIGANATILPGIVIGSNAMVGAGAVVTRSVPPNAIVMGNPARITGYAGSHRQSPPESSIVTVAGEAEQIIPTKVEGVRIHHLPLVRDLRGDLSAGEFERDLPFVPQRYFLVFDVPSVRVRGEHAHRECEQFLVCVKGSCSVVVDDGKNIQEFKLERANVGIHIPPMVWGTQYKYSEDAVLLVFASHAYNAADYIRDYQTFLVEKQRSARLQPSP